MNNHKFLSVHNKQNKYYDINFFSTHINFDAIEKLESKGEEFLFENILYLFKKYNKNIQDAKKLESAYKLAQDVHKTQSRESGAAFVTHPLIVALLAIPYSPCVDFLSATILHDTIEDYKTKNMTISDGRIYISDKIKNIFGETVYNLIEGVSKVANIKNNKDRNKITQQTIEKIFQHSAKDCRILLIKIFDRLHNIITISGKKNPEKRAKKVQEAITIYVPSAKRLGLWDVKNMLENACERVLNSNATKEKKKLISESYIDDKKNIIESIKKIIPKSRVVLEKNSFMNRAVHSNYILIELKTEAECFTAFSVLNKEFYFKKHTFSDYISRPKINKYKALHAQYVFNNSEIIEVHIVSVDMQKRNTFGVFVDSKAKDYSLSILSEVSLNKLKLESEQTLHSITNNILTPQLTIHNLEMGKNYISKGSTALDAGIVLYPNQFQNINKVNINGSPANLEYVLKNNDIVDFLFSESEQLERKWINFSFIHKVNISNILSKLSYSEKSKKGSEILQSVFDEKKLGAVDVVCNNSLFLNSINPKFESINDLYAEIYEGRLRGYECVYLYEEFCSKKKANKNIAKRMLTFSSVFSLCAEVETVFSVIAQKTSVRINNIVIERQNEKITGNIVVESSRKNIAKFMQAVQPSITCSYSMSLVFMLKAFLFFLLPIGISALIFTLLLSSVALPSVFLYVGAAFILFGTFLTYRFFDSYFAKIRNNFTILLSVIALNFLLSLGYIYIFFRCDYDIYNLGFYFPVILLVFSMGLPAVFMSKKNLSQEETISITSFEYKKKQKDKILGYILRFFAVVIWGIDPLIIKYSPLSEIEFNLQIPLLLLGASIFTFLSVALLGKENIRKDFRLKIDRYFIAMIISMLVLIFLLIASLGHTSSTNFILLNGFAPIFVLLIGLVFWKSSSAYFQNDNNTIKILLIFLLGGIGTSFVFYKDLLLGASSSFIGNSLALLYMIADIVFVTAQIQYMKNITGYKTYFMNFYLYFISFLLCLPLLLLNVNSFDIVTVEQISWAILMGFLWGLGTLLTFEAYRRIDGFIGFLMFNLAILITIFVESFILGEVKITNYLLIGGALIIGASILAEMINTKCEKENIIDIKK